MNPNEYTIVREIGRGGMGSVYEGRTHNGIPVAIKMLKAEIAFNPEFRELFESEARVLSQMSHPSVVKIMGSTFSDEKNNLYLPMEYIEGETIAHHVQVHGPYSENEAIALMSQILDAMSYVHSTNNAHRDIKPSNIMIRPNGSICVIDFGIAKDMKTHTGKTIGRVIGTDGYMSPEQANGLNIDHRTDIYSLGCLLHFMLTGKDAISKKQDEYATRMAIIQDSFPCARDLVPEITEHTQQAIYKAVDKNMLLRYQTATAFKNDLLQTAVVEDDGKTKRDPHIVSVSVGRRNCDIIMSSEYISSHHLDITWTIEPQTGGESSTTEYLVITDMSTNGVGVDGEYLHHGSKRILYRSELSGTAHLPLVLLAGRPEYPLDWDQVLAVLRQRGMCEMGITSSYDTTNNDNHCEDKLESGLNVLCFLFPIVGWVLGYIWKTDYPGKASSAKKMAWLGAIISLFISGLILIFK